MQGGVVQDAGTGMGADTSVFAPASFYAIQKGRSTGASVSCVLKKGGQICPSLVLC